MVLLRTYKKRNVWPLIPTRSSYQQQRVGRWIHINSVPHKKHNVSRHQGLVKNQTSEVPQLEVSTHLCKPYTGSTNYSVKSEYTPVSLRIPFRKCIRLGAPDFLCRDLKLKRPSHGLHALVPAAREGRKLYTRRQIRAVPESSLSHMRLRSRPVPLRRMKLVHGSRSGRLRSKLLEYQSRSLPHRSQVRKVQLFTHCSPKNFTACNFVATKRDPTAFKKHSRDFSALCSRDFSAALGTLQGLVRSRARFCKGLVFL